MRDDQKIMESRYSGPYNWTLPEYSMRWAHKEGLARIVANLLRQGEKVLDVGCGDGWYAARLCRSGATLSGVDVSERAVSFARLLVPEAAFMVGSAASLPYPDSSFDAIVCIQVLEHLADEDVAAALKEFGRVLRPGGRLVVSVPSVRRPMSKAHLRHYTEKSLVASLAGFGDVDRIVGHEGDGRALKLVRKLMDNRFVFAPSLARAFYEKLYFRRWSQMPSGKGANIVAVATKAVTERPI